MNNTKTQEEVNNNYLNVICVGRRMLYDLLSCEQPISSMICYGGWGADVYDFGNDAIITTYTPFGNIKPNPDLCKAYESKAQAIQRDYSLSYDERKTRLQALISEFIEEVTQ